MPDLEAIGDAATGATLAGTVEPKTGSVDGHTDEKNCLNCGAGLVGDYCHVCGQRGHVHRTLTAFWHDLAHGVLHLDDKVWRTLPLLAWRPGELTRRYAHGERARFVSPMALFLFSVFLMFAVFSLIGAATTGGTAESGGTVTRRAEAEAEMEQARKESQAELKALQQERAALAAQRRPTSGVDEQIRSKQKEISLQDRVFRETIGFFPGEQGDRVAAAAESSGAVINISGGSTGINQWFNTAYRKARENPSLLFYKLQANAYKFSWLLIPISIPLVWVLFLHRGRYRRFTAYDHTVFVTYSIAFMSLAAIVLSLLRPVGVPGGLLFLATLIIPPVHIYRQLKGAYGLSVPSALWRTAALIMMSLVALALFGALLLILGVVG